MTENRPILASCQAAPTYASRLGTWTASAISRPWTAQTILGASRVRGRLYADRLFAVALCQGAALHYIDGKNGVKDLDV
jgi:hypothetical protein